MIRRPPRSTLFPTRRSSDLTGGRSPASARQACARGRSRCASSRSEEHTSELQSHLNLVCRLLLEKKKPELLEHWFPHYPPNALHACPHVWQPPTISSRKAP